MHNIANLFDLDPRKDNVEAFKKKNIGYLAPEEDKWRLPFLMKLLGQRRELFICEEDTGYIDDVIDSLCAT